MEINLTNKQIDAIKILAMIILSVSMLIISFVVFKYSSIIKEDPCSVCGINSIRLLKELIK